jgi:predicted DNA-binding transcriptional regulator YafY
MAAQVPLFAMGTGAQAERMRRVLRRLVGRDVSLTEDTTAAMVDALEAIAARLQALESAAARTAAERIERAAPPQSPVDQS